MNKTMNDKIVSKVASTSGIDAATVKKIADQIQAHAEEQKTFAKSIDDIFYLSCELKGAIKQFPADKYAEASAHLTEARAQLTTVDALYRQSIQ